MVNNVMGDLNKANQMRRTDRSSSDGLDTVGGTLRNISELQKLNASYEQ